MGATTEAQKDFSEYTGPVNASAARLRGLWLSFILLLTYLMITVGAVTHVDLLLENPVRLPVLNIDLPLLGFFSIAPLFLLINHFYLLLQLHGLAKRARELNAEIEIADRRFALSNDEEHRLRRSLDGFVIVQMLAGSIEERQGWKNWLLRFIAWFTLVLAPVAILLQMQIQFLPYHNDWITWLLRGVVALDVGILLWFWPGTRWQAVQKHMEAGLRGLGFASAAVSLLASLLLITYKGERFSLPRPQILSDIHEWLFEGEVDNVSGSRHSWFSSTLVIPDRVLIDLDELHKTSTREKDIRLSERTRTLRLRGRNLQGAVFYLSDLRQVEFFAASLQGASLGGARLQGANLSGASLQGAVLTDVVLDRSMLDNTFVWRSRGEPNVDRVQLHGLITDQKTFDTDSSTFVKLDTKNYTKLKEQATEGIEDQETKDRILKLLEVIDPNNSDPEDMTDWDSIQKDAPAITDTQHKTDIAIVLDRLACEPDEDGQPYIAQGLARSDFPSQGRIAFLGRHGESLAQKMLAAAEAEKRSDATAKACPGAFGMDEVSQAHLRQILKDIRQEKEEAGKPAAE